MAGHLDVLMAMFPGQVLLDVDDIAKCLRHSKGHIYNLSSAKKLPFNVEWGLGDKVQVSIVEMARYLDSKLEQKVEKPTAPELVAPVVTHKKLGRPRGSSKTRIQLAFQSQLQVAIIKHEVRLVFEGAETALERIEFDNSETVACADKFAAAKNEMFSLLGQAKSHMNATFLDLNMKSKPEQSRHKKV